MGKGAGKIPKVLRVTIDQDPDTLNPLDGDLTWNLYTFKEAGHDLMMDVPEVNFRDNAIIDRKLKEGFAFSVAYRDVGMHEYTLDDEGGDGVLVWEHDEKELSDDIESRRTDAEAALREFSEWANGNCYAFIVERIRSVAPDFDPRDARFNGAFWEDTEDGFAGIIGEDYIREAVENVIACYPGYRIIYRGDSSWVMPTPRNAPKDSPPSAP